MTNPYAMRRSLELRKHIEVIDKAAEKNKRFEEIGVNRTFGAAYFTALESGNEQLDFDEVIQSFGSQYLIQVTEYACELQSQPYVSNSPFYNSDNARGLWYYSGGRWGRIRV